MVRWWEGRGGGSGWGLESFGGEWLGSCEGLGGRSRWEWVGWEIWGPWMGCHGESLSNNGEFLHCRWKGVGGNTPLVSLGSSRARRVWGRGLGELW